MSVSALATNWPRVVYAVLAALLAVCVAVATGAVPVPPALHDVAPYAGLVVVFLGALIPNAFDQGKPKEPPFPLPRG